MSAFYFALAGLLLFLLTILLGRVEARHKKSKTEFFDKKDWINIGVLTVTFAVAVFIRLGSFVAPQSAYEMSDNTKREIVLDLGEEKEVSYLSFFLGHLNGRRVSISSYNVESKEWDLIRQEEIVKSVFAWNKIEINQKMRYLGVVISDEKAIFNELAIVGSNNELIMPIDADKYKELFDEQNLFKEKPTYYDQTMFDEVYHGRTGYEFLHGLTAYENTHPPLGKSIISLGIKWFGMTPFGWRFMVAIFGTAMIPLMYLFAKRLFKDSLMATLVAALLCLDFMHFNLSRIATIDIIVAFFILLMYYFMYEYYTMNFYEMPLKKTFIPLGLCGITMGLAIATKWTGVYAAVGLAILFFMVLLKRYFEYRAASQTILFCMIFFVVIPLTIYCLSYIPFVGYRPYNGLLDKVISNMQSMFDYHSKLVATHPYESRWYEWLWVKRPLLDDFEWVTNTKVSTVSCFGNPFIWWAGIPAVLYLFKAWIWDKDRKAAFLCIAYSAQLVPWMFVTRCTFIYHYFAASLFMILCIGYCLQKIIERYKYGKRFAIGYVILVAIAFIIFYPVISGQPVNREWVATWLKWLKDWVFV